MQRFQSTPLVLHVKGQQGDFYGARRFYGCHFHSLTSHIQEVTRVFDLRFIVVENEERTFGDMRRISEATSNRHPESVVDNAFISFNDEQQSDLTQDCLTTQDYMTGLVPTS